MKNDVEWRQWDKKESHWLIYNNVLNSRLSKTLKIGIVNCNTNLSNIYAKNRKYIYLIYRTLVKYIFLNFHNSLHTNSDGSWLTNNLNFGFGNFVNGVSK